MSFQIKSKLSVLLFILLFLIDPPAVSASIVINEILPHPSSGADWIELYSTDSNETDISGWRIQDNTGDLSPLPEGAYFSSSSAFYQISVGNRLNNGGDNIKLKDKNNTVINEISYNRDFGEDVSLGRYPDGSNNWGVLTSSTPNTPNSNFAPTLTPTATPIPSAVPTTVPTNTPVPSATSKPQATITTYLSPTSIKKTANVSPTVKSEGTVLGDVSQVSATPVEEKITGTNTKSSFPVFLGLLGSGLLFIATAVGLSVRQIRSNQKKD